VSRIQVAYGHAMVEGGQGPCGYPVPTVVVHAGEEWETSVRVLYLSARDGRLRFRFQWNAAPQPAPDHLEATFLLNESVHPGLIAQATLSVDNEYRMDAELPEELARKLELLKVTDRMPFQLILRTESHGA
jgi:hypothetical protein